MIDWYQILGILCAGLCGFAAGIYVCVRASQAYLYEDDDHNDSRP